MLLLSQQSITSWRIPYLCNSTHLHLSTNNSYLFVLYVITIVITCHICTEHCAHIFPSGNNIHFLISTKDGYFLVFMCNSTFHSSITIVIVLYSNNSASFIQRPIDGYHVKFIPSAGSTSGNAGHDVTFREVSTHSIYFTSRTFQIQLRVSHQNITLLVWNLSILRVKIRPTT